MTKAIVDALLAEDDVEDVATGLDVGRECRRDGSARLTANVTVRLAQPDERLLEGQVPAVEVDPDAGAELVEQTVPGRAADGAELGEHALLGLGQLVGAELPRLLDHVAVFRGVRIA